MRAATRTVTDQASRGRGRGFTKHLDKPAVPGQSFQKLKNDDPTSRVAPSGQPCTNNTVKSALVPMTEENVIGVSDETVPKTTHNSAKPPAEKQEKGEILCALC